MDKVEKKMKEVLFTPITTLRMIEECAAITQEVALGFVTWFTKDVLSSTCLTIPKEAFESHETLYQHYINTIYNGE